MPVHPHVSGGLQKVYDFFKGNESAKDLLIGSIGAVIGGLFVERIVKRDEEEDEDQ